MQSRQFNSGRSLRPATVGHSIEGESKHEAGRNDTDSCYQTAVTGPQDRTAGG